MHKKSGHIDNGKEKEKALFRPVAVDMCNDVCSGCALEVGFGVKGMVGTRWVR